MGRIVDLSLDIYDKAPTFWPDPKTAVIEHLGVKDLKYNITQLVMSTHLGTHADAPYHFFDDGKTVDEVDPARGFGLAWVLDLSGKRPKEEISPADLAPYDARITAGARLVVRTGWHSVFPQARYFTDYPGLSPAACELLAARRVACLALDTPSVYAPDYVTVHHTLLRAEVLIVEGLAHLDRLEGEQVFLVALPLRVRGRDGAPCRAIAVDRLSAEEIAALGAIH